MKTDGTGRLTEFALTMIGIVGDNSAGHAKGIELFRSKDSVVFADIYAGGIRQTWQIRTKQFSHWLANIYFESAHSFPTQGQLKAIINQIEAQAQIDTPEREVFLRLGELGDRLYLDLVDKSWAAVEIDATGWRVVQQPQVRFVRAAGMLPLPVPERGGLDRDVTLARERGRRTGFCAGGRLAASGIAP